MIEVYRTKLRLWRWRLRAKNGRLVAQCAQFGGFITKQGAMRNIEATRRLFCDCERKPPLSPLEIVVLDGGRD